MADAELDNTIAAGERRFAELLELAGRERLKELERMAAESLASSLHAESAAGAAAAAAHLREHARLPGIQQETPDD
jgi:hypothetical protein